MKKNKLLALSLLACTLLAGCDEASSIQNGSKPVGTVTVTDKNGNEITLDTNTLTLQKFYEDLKTSSGGSVAVEKLLEALSKHEYLKSETEFVKTDSHSVKNYHTMDTFKADIEEKFQDIVDGTTYLDEDGNFDAKAYKRYVEDTLDYEVGDTASTKWLSADINEKLVYNYDKYIEEVLVPEVLQSYVYLDYLTGSTKYKGQFTNQYAVELEVLKVKHDTSKENAKWSEGLIDDVKNITSGNASEFVANADLTFVAFDSNKDLIVFDGSATDTNGKVVRQYKKYSSDAIKAKYDAMLKPDTNGKIAQYKLADITWLNEADVVESWTISVADKANAEFYGHVEQVLVARDLWKIDHEVVFAKNYDYKTAKYNNMTETEKSEAKGFAETYTSSNSKPMSEVAKEKKVSAQQAEYYYEPDYYTKSSYAMVLPTSLSSLRGSSAKELQSHLVEEAFGNNGKFLLPKADVADPVYLDVDSSTYYVCEVTNWYGYYLTEDPLKTNSKTKSISNYQIEAYQKGTYNTYKLEGNEYVVDKTYTYPDNAGEFASVIELVKVSAANILTDSMKKEAIVALFAKYGVEINDQEVYDYIKGQYPDYFEQED